MLEMTEWIRIVAWEKILFEWRLYLSMSVDQEQAATLSSRLGNACHNAVPFRKERFSPGS